VVRDLLRKARLVLHDQLFDDNETFLLVLELLGYLIGFGKLVGDIVFHLVDALSDLTELVFDTRLKILDLLQVRCACVNFNLQFGGSRLSIIKLSLFELEIFFHFSDISLRRKLVLLLDLLAHILKKCGNDLSLRSDLSLILLLLLFKLSHEGVDLVFFLVQNLILLHVISVFLVSHITLDLFNIPAISIDSFSALRKVLLQLLNFRILLLNPIH